MAHLDDLLSEARSAYLEGDLAAAENSLALVLEAAPRDVDAHVLLGVVRSRKGDISAAIERLGQALDIDDQCFEAHVAISTLLFRVGQPEKAIRHGERAIALQPQDPAAYHHLARDLIAHQYIGEAIPYLREALRLAPTAAPILQDLATALSQVGDREESKKLWTRMTKLHPALVVGWLKLGNLLLAEQQFKEAFVCGRRAIILAPELAEARILIGLSLLGGEGGAFEADGHLSEAVRLKPDGIIGHSAYGLALQEMGRFDEARPHFEKVLELSPTHGQSYYSLLRTRKTSQADEPLLGQLRQNIDNPVASPLDRSYMHYALGKAEEDADRFEEAMRHYDFATELAAQTWFAGRPANRERYSGMIDSAIDTFDPDFLGSTIRNRIESEKPLLVVGMIRSGTTLVEQILSSHPLVKGAGELPYWHENAPRIWDISGRKVDESALSEAAVGYQALLDRIGPESARVIDKLPHNFTMIGLLLASIAGARVIYVKRHPVDNCLSIYTTAYQHPPEFTLTRPNIVFSYREHERLMAHWRQVVPSHQLLEVQYEDLIENREAVTRRMIEFAGLEWDDACLHHERNSRSVNTPSVWQVRQPIYKTSVARWKKFEPWLGEFRELLPAEPAP